jgi:hypothetical protein
VACVSGVLPQWPTVKHKMHLASAVWP